MDRVLAVFLFTHTLAAVSSFRVSPMSILLVGSAAVACKAQIVPTSSGRTIAGPVSPAAQPAWLASLQAWRAAQRAAGNFSTAIYDEYLLWSPTLFIAPQSHIYDRFLYDPVVGWTPERFLDDLETRYGGVDGVLLWATYPNMGCDERSQFDLMEDLPGGVAALKAVCDAFHARGVRCGLPYNPWDLGTHRRGEPDEVVLGQLAEAVGADFVNGDTMELMSASFFWDAVAAGNPVALQPEGGPILNSLSWTKMGWGYWDAEVTDVDAWKTIEHRHVTQICNRWATSHTTDLQQAFFNGDGFVSWESVWGTWNGMSPRDCEATRRVGALLRFLAPFFSAGPEANSTTWTPHFPVTAAAYAAGVYATRWAAPAGVAFPHAATAYTLIASAGAGGLARVPTLPVPCDASATLYWDLYAGVAVAPALVPGGGGVCALPLALEAGGFGAVLALAPADGTPLPPALASFLARMAAMTAKPLASFSSGTVYLQQTMTPVAPAPLAAPPPGTVLVPGAADWSFAVTGTMVEGRTVPGNDVQFPWEPLASTVHARHRLNISNLYVDITPVTNAAYAAFLAATGYAPPDSHNFLRDWAGARTPPAGWERKPVTWVDLIDARAYCAHRGMRLPHDWEWSFLASNGTAGQQYPWGDTFNAAAVPIQASGTERPAPPDVGGYPAGDSPSGLKDLMGLAWQWTDEFSDAHTRAGLVRGGAYYSAVGSQWYFPNTLTNSPSWGGPRATTHNKLLLMGPSYDRHGTVGFRCVADAPGPLPPPPPEPPGGCADGSCDAYCDNAMVQGCAAVLPSGVSMRARATGKPCGGSLGPCAAAADACGAGWAPCLSDFTVQSLSADGFREHMTAHACATGDSGRWLAAMSHANCAECTAGPTSADIGCAASGCGSEAIACGSGAIPAGCKSELWPNATLIYGDNQQSGCGAIGPADGDGVLCCKV